MNSIIIGLNSIKRLFKEISALTFIVIFPIMAAFLTSMVYNQSSNLTMAVADNGYYDSGLIEFLEDTGKYSVELVKEGELIEKIENNSFSIGMLFSSDFVQNGNQGKTDKVRIISNKNGSHVGEMQGIIDTYYGMIISGGSVEEYKTNLVNSEKYIKPQISFGMITMFILMFTGTGIGMLLEDKRFKTFMRIYSTPIRQRDMVLGHLFANLVLGSFQILLFMITSTVLLKFQWGTSIVNVFLLLFLFLIVSIGISIALVYFTSDNQKHNIMITVIAVVTSLVSGAMMPQVELGGFLGGISKFTPQYWLVKAYNSLITGGSILDIKIELGILLVFGIALFIFGVNTLTPSEEDL